MTRLTGLLAALGLLGPYGPDTCKQGFVWRGAVPADHVRVTPATRDQTSRDNELAASRRA